MAERPAGRTRRRRLPLRTRAVLWLTGLLGFTVFVSAAAVLIAVFYGGTVYESDDYVPPPDLDESSTELRYCASGGPIEGCPDPTSVPMQFQETEALEYQRLLVWTISIVAVVVFLLAVVAAWRMVSSMLRPLERLGAAAESAAEGRLDHRIRLEGPSDEITDVTDTFDRMLAELERSFGQSERFAANASHELRTPLATMRTMLDVAMQRPEPPDHALLERLRATNERSIEIVDSLLDLAGVTAERGDPATLDVGAIVRETLDELAPRADAAGTEVRSSVEPATLVGDAALLRRLVANLVENALRHGDADEGVDVRTDTAAGRLRLVVENGGPVLEAADVERLPEPFVRGVGRTRAAGSGLGLAIVDEIVRRHDGALELEARETGGLRVTVSLPVVPPAAPRGRDARPKRRHREATPAR